MTDPGTPVTQTGTTLAIIPAGDSVTNGTGIVSGQLLRIYMPDAWTAAPVTFEVSSDGFDAYRPVFLANGEQMQMTVTEGAALLVPESLGKGLGWIRLRSGTHECPVIQPEERQFSLVVG